MRVGAVVLLCALAEANFGPNINDASTPIDSMPVFLGNFEDDLTLVKDMVGMYHLDQDYVN